MKKIIFIICMCMCLCSCQKDDTGNKKPQQTQEVVDENALLRRNVADFCSNVELFNSMLSILIANSMEQKESDFGAEEVISHLDKAREICDNDIANSKADTVYINDIKQESYNIVESCDILLELLDDSDLSDTLERQQEIEDLCEKLKGYLD